MDHSESLKKVGNRCSICGKTISGFGNNSSPFDRGPCCDDCNESVVLPLRIFWWSRGTHALVFSAEGTMEYVKPLKDTFSLAELQNYVEGPIEYLHTRENPKFHFIVNEEGLLSHLKFNDLAFEIFGLRIVGNLIVCPKSLLE